MFKAIPGSTLPARLLLLSAMIFVALLLLLQTASADHDDSNQGNRYTSGHTYKIISKNGSQIWYSPSQIEVRGRAARTYYRTNSGVVIYQKTPSFKRHSGYQSYPVYQQNNRDYQKHYRYKAHPHKRPHNSKKYSHALRQQLYQKQQFYKNLSERHGYYSRHNKYNTHQRKKSYHRKPNGQIVIILK